MEPQLRRRRAASVDPNTVQLLKTFMGITAPSPKNLTIFYNQQTPTASSVELSLDPALSDTIPTLYPPPESPSSKSQRCFLDTYDEEIHPMEEYEKEVKLADERKCSLARSESDELRWQTNLLETVNDLIEENAKLSQKLNQKVIFKCEKCGSMSSRQSSLLQEDVIKSTETLVDEAQLVKEHRCSTSREKEGSISAVFTSEDLLTRARQQSLTVTSQIPLRPPSSLAEKVRLLEFALESYDGDMIEKSLLLLYESLKPSLFDSILKTRNVAFQHFRSFRSKMNSFSEIIKKPINPVLESVLHVHERPITNDEFILKLERLLQSTNETTKIHLLTQLLEELNETKGKYDFEVAMLEHEIKLIEMRHKTQSESLKTVEEWLEYSLQLHLVKKATTQVPTPLELKKWFQIQPDMFAWIVARTLNEVYPWSFIEHFLMEHNAGMSPVTLSLVGFFCCAPVNRILHYLANIQEAAEQRDLAKRFGFEELLLTVI